MIRRALISVFDKVGVVELAHALHTEFGVQIISTGGTAKILETAGIPVTLVEQFTGSPELLDGRVKTLHPRIHAALLADRDNPQHMRQLQAAGIEPIDLVVVNLYPFERTVAQHGCSLEQAFEMIDIGGVTLLRAAAKNPRHVMTLTSPDRYDPALRQIRARAGAMPPLEERDSPHTAFQLTSRYDAAIASWLSDRTSVWPKQRVLWLADWGPLRYGENAHQQAALLEIPDAQGRSLTPPRTRAGGAAPMSFNNYLDADAALRLCAELSQPAGELAVESPQRSAVCVFVKHTNPCGVGVVQLSEASPAAQNEAQWEAYRRAYLGDPNAAMGGILACNFAVDAEFAGRVLGTFDAIGRPLREAGAPYAPGGFFLEVWVAPCFTADAVEVLRTGVAPGAKPESRKTWSENVRLLPVDSLSEHAGERVEYRSILGGLLMQTADLSGHQTSRWEVVTRRKPGAQELGDLKLAWLTCKHTKSNAISICKDGMLLGNGAGQMSRVMSCRIATWLARDNGHADRLRGSVAASDAFFPFRDGPELLIQAGVTALIQPGGSKRDGKVVAACDEAGVAMIFTGERHFRH